MYDTAKRVELVKKRAREVHRRRQRRSIYRLSCVCVLLFAALMQAAGTIIGRSQPDVRGAFGAILLRQNAGGYVLLGVVSFAAAVVITVVCMRLHEREKQNGASNEEEQT